MAADQHGGARDARSQAWAGTAAGHSMTTYDEVMADIRAGRAKGNGARSVPRPSKFKNVRCEIDGEKFDSKKERDRWMMLSILQRTGAISDLKRQVSTMLVVDGSIVARMRWDFGYTERDCPVVDDTKGTATADWLVKARLYQALNPGTECRINGVRMPRLKAAA